MNLKKHHITFLVIITLIAFVLIGLVRVGTAFSAVAEGLNSINSPMTAAADTSSAPAGYNYIH